MESLVLFLILLLFFLDLQTSRLISGLIGEGKGGDGLIVQALGVLIEIYASTLNSGTLANTE